MLFFYYFQQATGAAQQLSHCGNLAVVCPLCFASLANQHQLASHLAEHRQLAVSLESLPASPLLAALSAPLHNELWRCDLCNETTSTDWELWEHFVVCHSDGEMSDLNSCSVTVHQPEQNVKTVKKKSTVSSRPPPPPPPPSQPQSSSAPSPNLQEAQSNPSLAEKTMQPPATRSVKVAVMLKKFLTERLGGTNSTPPTHPPPPPPPAPAPPPPPQATMPLNRYTCFLCNEYLRSADELDKHLLGRHARATGPKADESGSSDTDDPDCQDVDAEGEALAVSAFADSPGSADNASCASSVVLPSIIQRDVSLTPVDKLRQHLLDRRRPNGETARRDDGETPIEQSGIVFVRKRKSATNLADGDGDSGVSSDGRATQVGCTSVCLESRNRRQPNTISGLEKGKSVVNKHSDTGESTDAYENNKIVKQQIMCTVCCRLFNNQLQLSNHTYRVHIRPKQSRRPGDRLPCPICPMAYDNVDELSVHMISHSS